MEKPKDLFFNFHGEISSLHTYVRTVIASVAAYIFMRQWSEKAGEYARINPDTR